MLKTKLLALVLLIGSTSQAQVVFEWAKVMGSTGYDKSVGIAIDASGNVYTTGYFTGTVDFDPGAGVTNLTSAGDFDIYISKFNATGTLVWAKRLGGTGDDEASGIVVDASGNVYSTGYFAESVDFDPGAGTANLGSLSASNIYISKLDAAGNYVWAKNIGGTIDQRSQGIAVDGSGNVFTTGVFSNTLDFDPGAGVTNLTSAGDADIFVDKLNAAGNFVWARNMGGINYDNGLAIAADASGNVYMTGTFAGTADFDPSAGTQSLVSSAASDDNFICKLNASGIFLWAKSIGNANGDYSPSIAVDASGNVFTTGILEGTLDLDPGAGTQNLSSAGILDVYISKLDASGNYVWAKKLGGAGNDAPTSIAVDPEGSVYTTGSFGGTAEDFDPGAATHNLASAGSDDIFISKLNAAGNYVWAASMGGTSSETGVSIAVNGAGKVYLTGNISGTADFDPGTGTQNLSSAGDRDIFIAQYGGGTLPLTLLQLQANNNGSAVQLQWQTTQEENTASFSIERSADGSSFTAIGSVAAANTSFKNNYAYTDAQPVTNTGFYRLKMIDIDGKFTYSHIVSVRRDNNAVALLISPNPATNILYVQATGNEPVTIQITDMNGRILQQQKKTLNGNTSFSINIQQLPTGSYYLLLKVKETQEVQPFLKQ